MLKHKIRSVFLSKSGVQHKPQDSVMENHFIVVDVECPKNRIHYEYVYSFLTRFLVFYDQGHKVQNTKQYNYCKTIYSCKAFV